jgi:hypothetical protein
MSGRVYKGLLGAFLAGGLMAVSAPNVDAMAAPEATSFEAIARTAEPAPDLDALAATYAADCNRSRREIDRARCRAMQSFVGQKLPNRLYSVAVDSPNVVTVSNYDATVKGFRMKVVGCLTCDAPLQTPAAGKRFLTLKVPGRDADSLGAGVAVARPDIPFDTLGEARAWETTVKPNLRAEFVFKAAGTEWSYRDHKGVAFEPVALRVYDRCNGHVVYSEPPSQDRVAVESGLDGCPGEKVNVALTTSGRDKEDSDLPEKLGALEIGDAVKEIRADVTACDSQFRTKGTVELEFDVAGTGGSAQAVRTRGQLAGTDVAMCLLQAAHKVQFPRFQQGKQTFRYSLRLDGK